MKNNRKLSLADTLSILHDDSRFKRVLLAIENGAASVTIGAAARAFFLASLHKNMARPFFVVTPSFDRARRMASDLSSYGVDAELFSDIETMPYDSLSPGAASVGRRYMLLDEMQSGLKKIWVTPVQSVLRVLPSPVENLFKPFKLTVGDEIDIHKLAESLVSLGYVREGLVEDHGQFSLRGGIVDIFPSSTSSPVRIEFFGDEVESIRSFRVSSQRSVGHLKKVEFYGCRQMVLNEENVKKAIEGFPKDQTDSLEDEIGKLKDLQYFEGMDKFMPFFYTDKTTALDYLPHESVIVFDEPEEVLQLSENFYAQQEQYIDHLIEHNAIVDSPRPYYMPPDILSKTSFSRVGLGSIAGSSLATSDTEISFKAVPTQSIAGRINELPQLLKKQNKKGLKVVLALGDGSQLKHVQEMLLKDRINSSTEPLLMSGRINLAVGSLSGGFESSDLGIAVITSSDIFGKHIPKRKKKLGSKGGTISSLAELAVGDYVVHSTHGIATYTGLQQREVAGVVRDYALLEYAGTDRLFVPIDQLDRLTKYIGASGETPPVTRLGSADWLKAKRKAQSSVKKIAFDLLSLYAQRAKSEGFAFSADTPWQVDLEDSFSYEETPDQLIAIEEVKRDMEQIKPMDRLICGDVGYGKTEVAVRAAFKAAMDGKQVIVLVPTTILAQQHGKTFAERLAVFPITVEMISRFKSPRQQKDIVERFNKGSVDVLIGTHRLLAKDVQPFDLGLVVVDEEQRFGVNDKEKLRSFKKSVDVLTLSATPIPRTLQMSVAGVRDMSTIETPPEGRHPIVTHVGRYDEEMIVEAIRREVGRGGQAYYVHNRVETIDHVAANIERLIPGAKIATAHGQMSEHALERIMLGFLDKQYDVLVCTTIIESGIDIPSVNTLVVDRAELLGLSQLYQLRGRVGRTSKRAYAYFFYAPQRIMTDQAFERLKTISDFTDLGSGIKIALRDLEIRGAGNLLGAEQHGYMSSVGFELYCQMLKEAIDEFEGNIRFEPIEIKIDLPVDAYIPATYIAEESLRIEVYKKIVLTKEASDIEQISAELDDRFGKIPTQVKRLLDIASLRQKARTLGIMEIVYQNKKVKILPMQLSRQQALILVKSYKNVIIRQERKYLLVDGIAIEKTVAFLNLMFDDIISAPRSEVVGSQKER